MDQAIVRSGECLRAWSTGPNWAWTTDHYQSASLWGGGRKTVTHDAKPPRKNSASLPGWAEPPRAGISYEPPPEGILHSNSARRRFRVRDRLRVREGQRRPSGGRCGGQVGAPDAPQRRCAEVPRPTPRREALGSLSRVLKKQSPPSASAQN